jgi:large subunit ribosomal protein L23
MKDAEGQFIKDLGIILSPIITEKATIGTDRNEVTFRVPLDATKPMIKEAVENLFKVKVKAVNTLVNKGKMKRFRGLQYKKTDSKKAIVTLEEGYQIDITTGL